MNFLAPDQTKAIVDQVMKTVPVGHTNAIVGTIDQSGAQLLISLKLDDNHWNATGIARHNWAGENSVGGSIVYSW